MERKREKESERKLERERNDEGRIEVIGARRLQRAGEREKKKEREGKR